MKLNSMVKYVLKQWENSNEPLLNKNERYARLLSKNIELRYLAPCYNRDGIWIPYSKSTPVHTIDLFVEYENSLLEVIFEGFKPVQKCEDGSYVLLDMHNNCIDFHQETGIILNGESAKTIEDLFLLYKKQNLEITITHSAVDRYKI